MMRSETRGVARGAIPKRSRSARGPPVCIISMAQQARPNIMYQTEDFRTQLRKSSTFVVSAISGAVLIRDIGTSRGPAGGRPFFRVLLDGEPLQPLEVALHPDVDEPDREDADEDGDLGEREATAPLPDPVVAEYGHDRVHERELDVEDHEHEGDQVEPDVEVDPGRAARRLAALVGGQLAEVRVRRTEKQPEPEHHPAEHEGEREEDEYVGELEVHAEPLAATPAF